MDGNKIIPRSNLSTSFKFDDGTTVIILKMEPESAGSWEARMRFPTKGKGRIPKTADQVPNQFLTAVQYYLETIDTILAGSRLDLLSQLYKGIDAAIKDSDAISRLLRPVRAFEDYSEHMNRHVFTFFGGSEIESWCAQMIFSHFATESLYRFTVDLQAEIGRGLMDRAGWYLAALNIILARDLRGVRATFGEALARGTQELRKSSQQPFG